MRDGDRVAFAVVERLRECSSSHRHTQSGRALAAKGVWCLCCNGAFHADCASVYHRDVKDFCELAVQEPPRKKKKPSKKKPKKNKSAEEEDDDEEEVDEDEEVDDEDADQ